VVPVDYSRRCGAESNTFGPVGKNGAEWYSYGEEDNYFNLFMVAYSLSRGDSAESNTFNPDGETAHKPNYK